ncbi:MAG: NAD(P)-dependent oxidoreductase [Polyangiales bacterium]|nr:NAD(P)-dependent oxidoreductase [Myxococcales bacterium]
MRNARENIAREHNAREKVLVTGACGNVGAVTVFALSARGYHVVALDLDTERNRARAADFAPDVDVRFGSICHRPTLEAAVHGVQHVIHLAAVIPPATDVDQRIAYKVNVEATRTLIALCEALPQPPRLTFTSSAAVFGDNARATPPRRSDEVPCPSDNYTRQKVDGERAVQASSLRYVIFRLAVTPPVEPAALGPFIFDMHADTRVEFTHPDDVALALANSLLRDDIEGRVLLLGGGARNRYTYRDWLNEAFAAMGIAPMPREAFGPERFMTDWVDSDESNALLDYQRRDYAQYLAEVRASLGPAAHVVDKVGPIARVAALANSRHWAEAHGQRAWVPEAIEQLRLAKAAWAAGRAWLPAWARRTGGRA